MKRPLNCLQQYGSIIFEHRRVFLRGFYCIFFCYIFISMYPLITLSISHCFKLLYFTITRFFLFCFFHSGTNWRERESAVLGTMFVLEKFDISINNGKFVMCLCVCVFF